jgi:hypothetical protein
VSIIGRFSSKTEVWDVLVISIPPLEDVVAAETAPVEISPATAIAPSVVVVILFLFFIFINYLFCLLDKAKAHPGIGTYLRR